MITAYFDGSGTLNQVDNYVVAGYFAPEESWSELSKRWRTALAGPPELKYFKIRESILKINQFEGWSDRCARARMRKFRRLVIRYAPGGVAVVLPTAFYRKHVRKNVPAEVDDPYFMCFLAAIELTSNLIGRVDGLGPIDFVFDSDSTETRARDLFEGFKDWPWENHSLVGSLDFKKYNDTPPLQTADSIAWLARTELTNPNTFFSGSQGLLTVDPPRPVRPHVLVHRLGESDLVRYVQGYQKILEQLKHS